MSTLHYFPNQFSNGFWLAKLAKNECKTGPKRNQKLIQKCITFFNDFLIDFWSIFEGVRGSNEPAFEVLLVPERVLNAKWPPRLPQRPLLEVKKPFDNALDR